MFSVAANFDMRYGVAADMAQPDMARPDMAQVGVADLGFSVACCGFDMTVVDGTTDGQKG
jgi:hypothetical protein